MRLEINSGGLDSFFNGVCSFINAGVNNHNSDKLINCFQNVANKTTGISGGVGTLGSALGFIRARKTAEETRKAAVQEVKRKTDNFIQTAKRVDNAVATAVNRSKETLYRTKPWLKPPAKPFDPFDPSTWNGESIGESCSRLWSGVEDAWDGIKTFYMEHKKVIDTVLIAVGAVLAIAAVVCTGGMALAPILATGLTTLGVGAGTALTIATATSLVVAGIAVTSTLASSTLNIIDTWYDMSGNSTFKSWQRGMNWTNGISNGLYSIGSIYNSTRGISGSSLRDYSKAWRSSAEFRNAIAGADKFNFTLKPNSSIFWTGMSENSKEHLAKNYIKKFGGSSLETTISKQGFPRPLSPQGWREASASFAMRSSGQVKALVGSTPWSGSIWTTSEKILLSINPNIAGIKEIMGVSSSVTPRVFQIGSFISGISSGGESALSFLKIFKR